MHINHKILGLEISHNDPLSGEILQNEDHGRNVKLCVLGAEQSNFSDGVIELLSLNKFDKGVEVVLIFEAFVVFHDEWMIQASQEIFLL